MSVEKGFLPFAAVLLLLLSMLVLPMCSSDPSSPKDEPQDLDLAGDWELNTTITSNTCGLTNGTCEDLRSWKVRALLRFGAGIPDQACHLAHLTGKNNGHRLLPL